MFVTTELFSKRGGCNASSYPKACNAITVRSQKKEGSVWVWHLNMAILLFHYLEEECFWGGIHVPYAVDVQLLHFPQPQDWLHKAVVLPQTCEGNTMVCVLMVFERCHSLIFTSKLPNMPEGSC